MSDLDQFRRETRAWLEANCPPEMRRSMTADEDTFWGGRDTKFASEPQRVWFERMRDKGWWSGDMHVHRPLKLLAVLMESEDLNVAIPLTRWRHSHAVNTDPDYEEFIISWN